MMKLYKILFSICLLAGLSFSGKAQTYDMSSGTVTACSGVFCDNGGSGANYPANEDRVMTFCSGTTDFLQFDFTQGTLSANDSLYIYDGNSTAATPIAIFTSGSRFETFTSTGTCVTFRFKSDGSGQSAGWQANFTCTSTPQAPTNYRVSNSVIYTCSGKFYDDGGTGNHGDGGSYTQTFYSSNGNRLKFDFTSFNTAGGSDILRIYDGPDTSYPLIGSYANSSSPGTVESSGNVLTFTWNMFTNGLTDPGWVADISCTTPALPSYTMSSGTVTSCEGVFYDNGGPTANYPANEDRIMTFCSGTSDFLQFDFKQASISGNDSLYIYDGNSTAATPVAVFTSGSRFETFTSTGTCVTFRFKSDGSTQSSGWQANFTCTSTPQAPTNYRMSNSVIYTCSGKFYDDGGTGNHGDGGSYTQTFYSSNGNRLKFDFTSFNTAGGSDILRIYDGPNTSYPLIGSYANSSSPGTIESSGNVLTFTWNMFANGLTDPGWEADISCTTAALPAYNMTSGTVTACSGVFYDNGGPTANYPANEDRIMTFCSGTSDFLQFDFKQASISGSDSLYIYDGNSTAATPIAIFTSGSRFETFTSTGTCVTFRFKSDGSTQSSGWQANFTCTSTPQAPTNYRVSNSVIYTCSGKFYDDGGTGNHGDGGSYTQTFYSSNGNRLKFDFTSFNTAGGSDILRIYDGPDTSYPLIGSYANSSSPGTVESSGNVLTFTWNMFANGLTDPGWEADISCTTPALPSYIMTSGTVTACSGIFYDNGGPTANYPAAEDRVMTFCSGSSDLLEFDFNFTSPGLGTGDTLWVYDGPNTSSILMYAFVKGSRFEKFTSTGSCVTFRFKSDGSDNPRGWQAEFNCTATPATMNYNIGAGIYYVCSGNFYDNGGSGGNYGDNVLYTQTFKSANGKRIKFDFSSFDTWGSDILRIYDGPDATYPWLGNFSGTKSAFSVESTGDALTFVFDSDGSNTKAGWQAGISCTTPILPVYNMTSGTVTDCEGVFYDNGGAAADYPMNEDRTMTFCSGTTDFLSFDFTSAATGLGTGDSLFIYDGPNTSSNPIAIYVNGSRFESFTSTGTCVTFRFKSDASGQSKGWQAQFSCTSTPGAPNDYVLGAGVYYVCSGNFYDNGGSGGNYGDNVLYTQTFKSANGKRIKFDFSSFDTWGSDILRIYDGPDATYPWLGNFSGTKSAFSVESTGDALTFVFDSDGSNTKAGWQAGISCTTPMLPVYNMNSGTVTACEGVFYDNGGPTGNYPAGEDKTVTFCSGTSDYLKFAFTDAATGLSAGDSLFIYDGPTTSSSPLAVYVQGSRFEDITSSGTCLTFRFKSDATTENKGWQAIFSCTSTPPATMTYTIGAGVYYTCSGSFVDDGGTGGNYNDAVDYTAGQTFISYSGCGIRFTFSQFETWGGDVLTAYDGPNTSSPLIGNYSGIIADLIIQSSGNALTFVWNTNNSGTSRPGFNAAITCPNVTAPPTPGSNSPVCVGSDLNLTASTVTGATYSWTGPDGFTSTEQNPVINNVTVAKAGTYTVTALVGTCASTDASVSVAVETPPSTPNVGSNSPVCAGGSINLTCDPVSGATYSWSGPDGFTSTNQNPSIASATTDATGTYTVTATVGSCTVSNSTSVTVNLSPGTVTASSNGPVCAGTDLDLTASSSGATAYSWSGPNGFTSSDQNPTIAAATTAASGIYTVTASIGSCTKQTTVNVTVSDAPTVPTAGSNGPICSGNTLNLTAAAVTGATYSWSGPNGFTSTDQNPSILSAATAAGGTYTVTASIGSCSEQSTVNVTVNPSPSVPVAGNNGPLCEGEELDLTAATIAGATYSWSGPNSFTSTDQNPSITSATTAASGTYTVTAIIGSCSEESTTNVTVSAVPVADAGTDFAICAGTTLNVSSNTVAGASYSWSGPNGFTSSDEDPSISSATTAATGTYTVTITVGSCTDQDDVNVTVNPAPAIPTAGNNGPLCEGEELDLTAATIAGATYSWSGPNSFTSTDQNPTISAATAAASGTYTVTASIGSCSEQSTTSVTVSAPPVANAGGDFSICEGTTLNLSANTVAGAAYSWTGPNGFTSANEDPSIASATAAAAGTYTLTITVGTCSDQDDVTVTVNPTPTIPTAGNNGPVCEGEDLDLTAVTVAGASYSWSGPNGFTSTAQNPTISAATAAASGTYTVTASIGSCSEQSTTNVTVSAPPVANAGGDFSICEGETLNLSANTVAGASYSWSGPNGFTSSDEDPSVSSATTSADGIYTVIITVGSCSDQDDVEVTVNPAPAAPVAGSNSPVCAGDDINLTASNITGATYSWTGPNGFNSTDQNPVIASVTTFDGGTYSVVATVGSCQSVQENVTVTVNSISTVTASNLGPYCAGETIQLNANTIAGASYSWNGPNSFSSTDEDPTISNSTAAAAGTYTVTVTLGACTAQNTTSVTMNSGPAKPTITLQQFPDRLVSSSFTDNQWSKDGVELFGEISQNLLFPDLGVYTVTVTGTNGCSSTSDPYYYGVSSTSNGIGIGSITAYPNPSEGIFQVKAENIQSHELKLSIRNALGIEVTKEKYAVSGGSVITDLHLQHLSKGVYYLHFDTGNEQSIVKVVIQ